jgi:hypothetical protein
MKLTPPAPTRPGAILLPDQCTADIAAAYSVGNDAEAAAGLMQKLLLV